MGPRGGDVRTYGRTDVQTYGCTDVRTYGWTENLPILQDFVPYRGRCPATAQLLPKNCLKRGKGTADRMMRTKSCRMGRFSVRTYIRTYVRPSVPPSRAQEPARQALNPASQASEPARQASEPTRQASEPVRQATEPPRQASEPVSQASEALRPAWLALRSGWQGLRPAWLDLPILQDFVPFWGRCPKETQNRPKRIFQPWRQSVNGKRLNLWTRSRIHLKTTKKYQG